MTIIQKAAQFFQNVSDYLDPRAAWERKRAVHHELNRRAKGNFTGRDWTTKEFWSLNADRIKREIGSNLAKAKQGNKNEPT